MAKAIAVPTSLVAPPGSMVSGATQGIDWVWTVAYAGADIPGGSAASQNVVINVVAADTLITARNKLQAAIITMALRQWGATVLGTDILMCDLQFGV